MLARGGRVRERSSLFEAFSRCIIAGLHRARRLAATEPLQPCIAEEVEPGPDKTSDDDMLAQARARGSTIFHPSGTGMMAPASNPMAAVDHALRVHGLEALRVADAAIMPTVVSGNTNAARIIIGETCAEMMPAVR
jgi:choline dehydrogenase